MAHNSSPETMKIVGATKGSVILEMLMNPDIAETAGVIILSALSGAEQVLNIKIKSQELRGLKLHNDRFAAELEAEAENEKLIGIEKITSDMVLRLGLNEKKEGDKIKALDTAIKSLVNFIEKGGVVDLIAPNDDEEESDEEHVGKYEKLRVTFEQIRQLEHNMVLLEYDALKDA